MSPPLVQQPDPRPMRQVLIDATTQAGVITRDAALRLVREHVLDAALASGALCRIFPCVYALPELVDDIDIRRTAALRFRPRSALSHLDALDVWRLPGLLAATSLPTVHVTVDASHHVCRVPGIMVHRRRGFAPEPPAVVMHHGLAVVRIEQAIVESWRLLPELDRRVPVIVALRERRTTGARLLRTLAANGAGVAGTAEMRRVFGLVAAGCHSPLELWGHEHVFSHRSLPPSRCQVPIRLPSGLVYLDRFYDEELVNVELDGAGYHGEPGQRERDLRRDAALASRGIQTVRYSHPDLYGDPERVRAQTLEVLRVRRGQLGRRTA